MSIYIVSNREIENEKFRDDGKEKALPTFRVATCKINEKLNIN